MSHMPWMMPRTDFPRLLLGFLIAEGKQHIHVREREQVLAAVASQGDQRNIQPGLPGESAAPHFNEDAVDHCGAAADGGGPVPGAFVGLAHKRHLLEILLP